MSVVVTGATGHVGANLVRALLAGGRKVRTLVREDTRGIERLDVERVSGDVRDRESLDRAFVGAEVVYNLAAKISIVGPMGGLVEATNVGGVRNMVEACKAAGVKRLVHFASIHAFEQRPLDETLDETRTLVTPPAPSYDVTKAGGIRVVLEAVTQGLDAVVVCPTAVLGPHDYKGSRMGLVIRKLATGKLPGSVVGGFDWVDVRDIVAGAMAAEERGRTGEIYLLGGAWTTVTELAKVVEEVTGQKAPWFCSPMWLAHVGTPFSVAWAKLTGSEPLFTGEALHALKYGNRQISTGKAARDLGYSPRPLLETIRAVVEWQREAGFIK
ncbi:MAG: NAD-dependent epimerase/dehydratase family protein [Pseudomonadota bacterium]